MLSVPLENGFLKAYFERFLLRGDLNRSILPNLDLKKDEKAHNFTLQNFRSASGGRSTFPGLTFFDGLSTEVAVDPGRHGAAGKSNAPGAAADRACDERMHATDHLSDCLISSGMLFRDRGWHMYFWIIHDHRESYHVERVSD